MYESMDEFSFIAKYLKPLAANFPGSLNLSDDAAVISPPPNCELVVTKDALAEGVHFIGSEAPELIAGKALRVNLSDLAAMGATPLCYFLALMLPQGISEDWLEKFASGLAQTQAEFSIFLAGGDTTATGGKLAISITAIGSVPQGAALKRSGAEEGDDIYVSGTLGDAGLGLELLKNMSCQTQVFPNSKAIGIEKLSDVASSNNEGLDSRFRGNDNALINRYLIPQPRIELGVSLRNLATACMDISDGLAQDLGHICTASNVGAEIYADKLPISEFANKTYLEFRYSEDNKQSFREPKRSVHKYMSSGSAKNEAFVQNSRNYEWVFGGDDYELLFTAPPNKKPQIMEIAKSLQLPLTHIGKITTGNGVKILDEYGAEIILDKKGYKHF